jgi:hypothetical protein
MAYSKQENAIVERSNKESMRHLKAILFDERIGDEWQIFLPIVHRIVNASVHESLGVSPAQILFGNAVDLDRGLFIPVSASEKPQISNEWLRKMYSKQALLIHLAQEHQVNMNQAHMYRQSDDIRTEFPLNSYVLVRYPESNYQNKPTKIHMNFKGPMRVVNFIGSKYTLQNLVSGANEDHHITSLKKFEYNPAIINPKSVAVQNAKEFFVEAIISHRGEHGNQVKNLQFLVHWAGYSHEDETWEPWANLRSNPVLHTYLYHVDGGRLRKLIPPEFRNEPYLKEKKSGS